MSDDMSRISWSYLRGKLEILPASLLLASALMLSSPQDRDVHTITLMTLIVSFSVCILVYRPILQAVNFHRFVAVLALCCILHRALGYSRVPNITDEKWLKEEVISCLRQFLLIAAYVCFALVMTNPFPDREIRQGLIDVETANIQTPAVLAIVDVRSVRNWDGSSLPENIDQISNDGSLPFRRFGPASSYSGNSESDISLSSLNNRVNSSFALDVFRWSAAANQTDSVRESDTSTEVQTDIYERR